jgi:ABC-type glycerol-3-phosphate transport system substrate-binding protein
MDPKAAFWLMPWVWQNGARIMSDDQRTVTVDTPEFVDAIAFVRDLMYRHGVMDPALARGAKVNDLWSSGAAAIVLDGSWKIGRYDELFPQWKDKWDVAPVPAGKQAVSFFGGQHLVMSKQTRRPDLAWRFMAFATSPQNQRLYSTIMGYPPGNLRVYQTPGYLDQQPYMRIVPEVIRTGRNNPFAPFFRNIWYELFQNRVLDVVMTDPDADIAQTVREAAREMQAVADRYWATHDYFIQGAPDKKDEG